MTQNKEFLFPLFEAHVRVLADAASIHIEGLPDGPDTLPLPSLYKNGIRAIYNLMESMVPLLSCICISGIWDVREAHPFTAFDIWIQQETEEGFYLPMASALSLFRENGIPYYHRPLNA